MSANLLEGVTPGPLLVEPDGHPDEFALAVVSWVTRVETARLRCLPGNAPMVEKTKANAQLFSLAYDHALLQAALTMEVAQSESAADGTVWLSVGRGPASTLHAAKIDAFGCPALTNELRAALRAAVLK